MIFFKMRGPNPKRRTGKKSDSTTEKKRQQGDYFNQLPKPLYSLPSSPGCGDDKEQIRTLTFFRRNS